MKALVTGGAGFIGSHLVDRLVADGHTVTVVDPADPVDPFPDGVKHIQKRVQDTPAKMGERSGYGAVFHLAGPVGPVGVLGNDDITLEIIGMADWLRQFTCPVVFVSTSEVYGPQPRLPVVEEDNPIIVYGNGKRAEYASAKLAAEMMLRNTLRNVRIIRPFNVAGPRQMPGGGFVLPRFVQSVVAGEPMTVYGDGQMVRAFTHVADIVEGIYRAALMGHPGAVYNLGNNANAMTIEQLAHLVAAVMGGGEFVHVDPVDLWGASFREAPDKTPETAYAFAELDWVPQLTAEDVVTDTVEWWLGRC